MRALVIAAFMMLGSVNAAAGQFTIINSIDYWVDAFADRELEHVAVQMATFPFQNNEIRFDDRRVVADLRRMGLRALRPELDQQDPDLTTTSYVIAHCMKTEFLPSDPCTTVSIATSINIEIWDHVRRRPVTVYRALAVSTVGRTAYRSEDEVEDCADLLSDPLIRMGFER